MTEARPAPEVATDTLERAAGLAAPAPPGRAFYGWWVTGGSFSILFLTVGVGLYSPPVFLLPLQEAFGWSRASIALGGSLAALIGGFAAPLVGVWIDRFGVRRVMLMGALVMGPGFLALGAMSALWQLYALNMLISFGLSCVAWLPNQALIARWFERRRGLAMGISVSGIGFGGLAIAPLAGLLIERIGWRGAYLTLGGLVLVIVTGVILATVRDDPADLGLQPDGEPVPPGPIDAAYEAAGLEVGEALRTTAFRSLAALHFFSVFANLSVIAHLVAFLRDQGLSAGTASLSLGLMVGASVLGRLLFGVLADRHPKHLVLCTALLLHAASVLLLFRIGAAGALPAFILLFGTALGAGAVMMPLIVGECFGLRAFGRILGLSMIPATLGAAVGPVLTGRIFDVTGSYAGAFALHGVAFLLAAGLALLVRRPKPVAA